jgi:hypothetical protein
MGSGRGAMAVKPGHHDPPTRSWRPSRVWDREAEPAPGRPLELVAGGLEPGSSDIVLITPVPSAGHRGDRPGGQAWPAAAAGHMAVLSPSLSPSWGIEKEKPATVRPSERFNVLYR